jgi:hypothetical protein
MTASTHLITANRLRDGAAVWLGDNARWVEYAASAARFDETVLEEQLAAARNGADVIDVRAVPAPLSYREQIRSSGPSVRADLGTQADHPPPPIRCHRRLRKAPRRPVPASIAMTTMIASFCAIAQRSFAGRSSAVCQAN